MSGLWPANAKRLNGFFPIEVARTIHFPVMVYFVLFIVAHVTLVFSTGALRNLNHMYNGSDDHSWAGFIIFAVSIVGVVTASLLARPAFLRPVASLTGKLSRN
jgi:hypothetical protein